MNEADARKKWCPFSRVALTEGMAANRTATMGSGDYADIKDETRCLASDCMAWRWGPDRAGGYCGLAGKPG
jgi:hypothetical protein